MPNSIKKAFSTGSGWRCYHALAGVLQSKTPKQKIIMDEPQPRPKVEGSPLDDFLRTHLNLSLFIKEENKKNCPFFPYVTFQGRDLPA